MNHKLILLISSFFAGQNALIGGMLPKFNNDWGKNYDNEEKLYTFAEDFLKKNNLPTFEKNNVYEYRNPALRNLTLQCITTEGIPQNHTYTLIDKSNTITHRPSISKQLFVVEKERFFWTTRFAYAVDIKITSDKDAPLTDESFSEIHILSQRKTIKKKKTAACIGAFVIGAYCFKNYLPEALSISSLWGLFAKK